jgi:hypothetical protein
MEINKKTTTAGWGAFTNQRQRVAELEIENQKLRDYIKYQYGIQYGKQCVITVSKDTDDVITMSTKEHELLIKHPIKNEQSLEIPNSVNNTFITENNINLQTETSHNAMSVTIIKDNKRTRDMSSKPRLKATEWSKQWNKNTRIRYVASGTTFEVVADIRANKLIHQGINKISYYKYDNDNNRYDESKLIIENSWNTYSRWIVATGCSIKKGSTSRNAYDVCEYYNEATNAWIKMDDVAIVGNKLN